MFLKLDIVNSIMLIFTISAFPVGKTAVITLEFPHGAENCGMGEVGVSLADNLNSVYWNPASLPAIGKHLSLQYIYSYCYEDLLPSFNIEDLWHSNKIHAVFINNVLKNIDFGASYSRNFLNFGENKWEDEFGRVIGHAYCSETVRSFAAGVQYSGIASIGLTIKDFESRLAPGYDSITENGIGVGQVFDFGMRLEKKFTIADAFDIHPAIGFALHSFPRDSVSYILDDTIPRFDPLPIKRWYGASIDLNAFDMVGVTFAKEREYAVIDREFIDHEGWKIRLTPFFAFVKGSMTDSAGKRYERNNGQIITLNYQQTHNALLRLTHLFNPRLHDKLQKYQQWTEKHHLKPNIHLQYARSVIHTQGDNDSREGQTRSEFSIGVSLIGDLGIFPSKRGLFKKDTKMNSDANTKPDDKQTDDIKPQEDDELVE